MEGERDGTCVRVSRAPDHAHNRSAPTGAPDLFIGRLTGRSPTRASALETFDIVASPFARARD